MRCTQAVTFCLLVGLVQGQRDCSQSVKWGDLLEDLNILVNSPAPTPKCNSHRLCVCVSVWCIIWMCDVAVLIQQSSSKSIDCGYHDDKTSLCDAQKMLNMVRYVSSVCYKRNNMCL